MAPKLCLSGYWPWAVLGLFHTDFIFDPFPENNESPLFHFEQFALQLQEGMVEHVNKDACVKTGRATSDIALLPTPPVQILSKFRNVRTLIVFFGSYLGLLCLRTGRSGEL